MISFISPLLLSLLAPFLLLLLAVVAVDPSVSLLCCSLCTCAGAAPRTAPSSTRGVFARGPTPPASPCRTPNLAPARDNYATTRREQRLHHGTGTRAPPQFNRKQGRILEGRRQRPHQSTCGKPRASGRWDVLGDLPTDRMLALPRVRFFNWKAGLPQPALSTRHPTPSLPPRPRPCRRYTRSRSSNHERRRGPFAVPRRRWCCGCCLC